MRTSLRRIVGITTSIAGLTGIALTAGASPAAAHHQPGHEHGGPGQGDVEVTICHATNSNANPYRAIVVDVSAIDGEGNGDHYPEHDGPIWDATLKAQHIAWGDIIPPLEGVHDGQNWAEGEAWLTNPDGACTAPAGTEVPDTADITLDKVVTGAAAPAGTTEFTFTVVCDGDEADRPAVVITPAQDAAVVAEDVAVGDTCEITETAGSPSWTVRGIAAPAGSSVEVTVIEGDETVAVVATNDFPATVVQDVCPEEGVQPPGTTCTVQVEGVTVTPGDITNIGAPAPVVAAAAAPAAVAAAELPRTGASNGQLTALALGLLLVGIGVSMLSADLRRGLARVV